jgi:hypothetical protein
LKGENIYYSSALLDDVVSVIVFNDPSNSLCKGVFLYYVASRVNGRRDESILL